MRRLIVLVIVIAICSSVYAAESHDSLESFWGGYLDAIREQDWTAARGFWLPDELGKSSRLGITYRGVQAKYDYASTLVTNADKFASGLMDVTLENVNQAGDNAEFGIRFVYQGDTARVKYYAQMQEGRWYFVPAMYAHAKDWKEYPTRFARVYCHDESLVNNYALDALDDFIAGLGRLLAIDSNRMALLENEKVDYYLCSESDFERLTGYNAHGITNLPFDAIITRHLPHPHEITHFMINYALRDLPLYTLPLIQEGLAVAQGGRWEKSPAVLDQLGWVLLKNKFCSLDELLTFDNFNIDLGMPDISYPVSGLFVDYLLDKLGMVKFRNLYLDFSGTYDDVKSWDKTHIISICEKYLGLDWDSIQSDFLKFSQQYETGGITAMAHDPSGEPLMILADQAAHVRIFEDGDYYLFEADSMPDSLWGTILMNDRGAQVSPIYQSALFYEHIREGAYHGQIYALQFNAQEAGFYNFFTNILEAKYISTFFPDLPYRNPSNGKISFRLSKKLMPGPIENYKIEFVLQPSS